jgi:8-oxo-dGTP pyrophosphatase MutT (NUDIX family)
MNIINKNNNACNNCGKQGHSFHQCKLPITSYGVIAFKATNSGIQYLMLRRKDSFGYIDFIRGKYSPYNISQIQDIVNEMSIEEKQRILVEPFDILWKNMWGDITTTQYKVEENASMKKMEIIRAGVSVNGEFINLEQIIKNSDTNWIETEWEFPKGRRNYKEKDLDCALREFEEETGISSSRLTIVENVLPFEETFIGTNHKSYKHKYFLAFLNDSSSSSVNSSSVNSSSSSNNYDDENIVLNGFQITEVSKLEWKTISSCLESIRPYSLEKKNLILNINKVLEEYRLYS